jgi:predicted site-specific integrase-resolvase
MNETLQQAKSCSTKKDVAAAYGVTERTVDNWMKEGWLPYLKIGSKICRYNLEAIERAMVERFTRNQKRGAK